MSIQRLVVFEEVYKDQTTGEEGSIWVAVAVEQDSSSQGSDPVEAVQALQSALEAEAHICAERNVPLPGPTPKSVLRRVMGLDTGLLPNREFVRDRIAVMAKRPQMYALSRESFLMQVVLLMEFADVAHPRLELFQESAELGTGAAVEGLQLEVDDVWVQRVIERAKELLG